MSEDLSFRDKAYALKEIWTYRPKLLGSLLVLSLVTAVFEGFGLTFILPILELAQSSSATEQTSGFLEVFVEIYALFGIPLTLESAVAGVAIVMTLRFTLSFIVGYATEWLRTNFVRDIQTQAFVNALGAQIAYFDNEGSDDILNAIITQAVYSGRVFTYFVRLFREGLLMLMYLGIAFYMSPRLTIAAVVGLGGMVFLVRYVFEPGYELGDRVADANERVQKAAQAGTQGIRDVKLFGLTDEITSDFRAAIDQFATAQIRLRRNRTAMDNFYQLVIAVSLFVLIYAALRFTDMSISSLAVFLFAIFRLGPRVSFLNKTVYQLDGNLPHLIRTQRFIDDIQTQQEPLEGEVPVPDIVDSVEFDNVSFSYEEDDQTITDLSFSVAQGEFVAFVGPSGAGKSTIVSLLTRMYDPDSGQILANDTDIERFNIRNWRSHIAVVRQNPYIFNDTLRYNLTVGNRDASAADIERVCELAEVSEFLDSLPNGYETELGDDGVKLSGGQRQRVAIARALLMDVDLLILDEGTSDLDTHLEKRVHHGIEDMERDFAIVVIAHRLSTVTNATRICTLKDGKLTESGTHRELLEQDGAYAELYRLQSEDTPVSTSGTQMG